MNSHLPLFEEPTTDKEVRHDYFGIKGLAYRSNFLDRDEQERILSAIDQLSWRNDLSRRVQHYGYKYDYKSRRIDESLRVGPLPEFARALGVKLVEEKLIAEIPDQVIVNEYVAGQGISNHIDCEPCFKDTIVTVSLGSVYLMDFLDTQSDCVVEVPLELGSALILSGEARYRWRHGIKARKSDHGRPRGRRVSLTFRNVILADAIPKCEPLPKPGRLPDMFLDSIANFPLRNATDDELGTALGRSQREYLVWHGQATAIERFPVEASQAGVASVIAERNRFAMEIGEAIGILKSTSAKVLSNAEIARQLAEQQVILVQHSARIAAVALMHSALERHVWRLVRFGMLAERGKAIERVAKRQLTVQELCDSDKDSLVDQRLEKWWTELERSPLLEKWDALISLFGSPDKLRDGKWHFDRDMLVEFDQVRNNCVHHDGHQLKTFDFSEFESQLVRAQWIWLTVVALKLNIKIPAETMFAGT